MITQVSFVFEDNVYYTFEGCNYTKSKFPAVNAIPRSELITSVGVQREIGGKDGWQSVPSVDITEVYKDGEYFLLNGSINYKGTVYEVKLSPSGLELNEPVAEPEVEPAEETVTEVDVVEEVLIPMSEVVAESQPRPKQQPAPPSMIGPGLSFDRSLHVVSTSSLVLGHKYIPSGCSFNAIVSPAKKGNNFKWRDKSKKSAQIPTLQQPAARYQQPAATFQQPAARYQQPAAKFSQPAQEYVEPTLLPRPKRLAVQEEIVDTISVPEAETAVKTDWVPEESIGNRPAPEPIPEPEPETEPEPPVVLEKPDEEGLDREARKLAARKSFTKDVDAIIGQIPVELLGDISEFTTNEVDVESLKAGGSMYCVNARWHKQGRWYCIDVVPNNARFFFNANQDVAIEIPRWMCKKWADALR